VSESTQKLIEDLKTLRDELRLQIHLAGMDARTTWAKLEEQLEDVERQLKSSAVKLKGAFEKLRDDIKSRN
jgi:hypothetical protein